MYWKQTLAPPYVEFPFFDFVTIKRLMDLPTWLKVATTLEPHEQELISNLHEVHGPFPPTVCASETGGPPSGSSGNQMEVAMKTSELCLHPPLTLPFPLLIWKHDLFFIQWLWLFLPIKNCSQNRKINKAWKKSDKFWSWSASGCIVTPNLRPLSCFTTYKFAKLGKSGLEHDKNLISCEGSQHTSSHKIYIHTDIPISIMDGSDHINSSTISIIYGNTS